MKLIGIEKLTGVDDRPGKRRKFPTKADLISAAFGFLPAALVVGFGIPLGGLWVFLLAVGGYYVAKGVAVRLTADPKNLPHDVLVQALFENAILHAQNLVSRLKHEPSISTETRTQLVSHTVEYALVIMIFYFHHANRPDLVREVTQKHEDFWVNNCDAKDLEIRKLALDAWRQENKRKMFWLDLGGNAIQNPDQHRFSENILSDSGFRISEMDKIQLRPYIEQFVLDVRVSMKHFGIS